MNKKTPKKHTRQIMQIPEWKFSPRQLISMYWWTDPRYSYCAGIIADGAVRSGKTVALSFGFLIWSMSNFNN